MKPRSTRNSRENGFTLIEAMVSLVILTFGILALAAVYTQGIVFANIAQYDYIAEKKAEETVETIFTARDTQILNWAAIQNVTNGGVFLDGPQPLLVPGTDGLLGTQNDAGAAPDVVIIGPGPDKQIGTADDIVFPLTGFMTREIQIFNIENQPNLRQIVVTVNYQAANKKRQYVLVSYISAFA